MKSSISALRPLAAGALVFLGACASSPARLAPLPAAVERDAEVPATAPDAEARRDGAVRQQSSPATTSTPAAGGIDTSDTNGAGPGGASAGSADSLAAADATGADAIAGSSSDLEVDPYVNQARVEHYVARFTGPARGYIEKRLERGSRYEPMIRRMLREGGLPEDMYYLALVESGFDPNAYSRAAAVGMWQFMTTTARGMGLRVDWWVDERRDPVRSTAAAVRFLRGLNEQFGSMYLAAAAYNGGPGRVARGLSKYADALEGAEGEEAFFALAETDHLRRETREYVPQLIAAALIGSDPQRYGLTVRRLEPFAYDSVRAPAALPLAAAARAAGTTVQVMKELNPQILRGMTPPTGTTLLRLPLGTGAGFSHALDSLPADEKVATRRITSRKGDSWSRLAAKEKVPASTLRAFNPKARVGTSGRLIPGQRLLVPSREVAAAALSVPDPAIERYGSTTRGRTVSHVVRPGETLSHIALRYRTTTRAIMSRNRLRKPLIFPGQELEIGAGNGATRSRGSAKASRRGSRTGASGAKKGGPTAKKARTASKKK